MTFHVVITNNAEMEIAEIFAWIAPDAPDTALRWVDRLEATIRSLDRFPRRGKRVPERDEFAGEVRQILFGDYRIIYLIVDRRVEVLHVRHQARRAFGND